MTATTMKTRDLLPEYAKDPRWLDMCDSIDVVVGAEFVDQSKLLKYLRHHYIPNDVVDEKTANREMIDASDWDTPDRKTAALLTELSGLRVSDSSFLTAEHFTNLHRNVASFWYSKGLFDVIDFIAFCINERIQMVHLWTKDYVTFIDEETYRSGERSGLYAPLYLGGDWYPTTHVRLRFTPKEGTSMSMENQVLVSRLFLDLSNFNLVLQALEESRVQWIADAYAIELADGSFANRMLYAGAYVQERFYISQAD